MRVALDPPLPGFGGGGDHRPAARFPLAVKELLEQGLALRDRYLEQKISLHGLWTATGRLEAKLDRLLARNYQDPANRRLAKHLRHERPYLFTFLYGPGLVDATDQSQTVPRDHAPQPARASLGVQYSSGHCIALPPTVADGLYHCYRRCNTSELEYEHMLEKRELDWLKANKLQ